MSSALERKNQQVWDALDANNVKQALQICSKRLKKGERGSYLKALQAYCLTCSSSAAQKQEGFLEIKTLIEDKPSISETEVLSVIQQALTNLSESAGHDCTPVVAQAYSTKLWERALKAKPDDEELGREWFFSSFQSHDWKNAQKAAMSLQRMCPIKRDYFFWAVLCCHLISVSEGTPGDERKLFGTLAYRMISKAASGVPTEPQVLLSPGRSIQTPQELHLLLSIYREYGQLSEALAILDSQNLGITSSIAKGDWSLIRTKLDILEDDGEWQVEWEYSKSILETAFEGTGDALNGDAADDQGANGDDWRVWQGFINASGKLGTNEIIEQTKSFVERSSAKSQTSRNALLAALLFSKTQLLSTNQDTRSSEIESACFHYFEYAVCKTCCYNDLRPYLDLLNKESQVSFLKLVETSCERVLSELDAEHRGPMLKLAARVNVLKIRYHLQISQERNLTEPQNVLSFITDCLHVYRAYDGLRKNHSVSESQAGSDACALAVMSLVHLSSADSEGRSRPCSTTRLLQAALLLEFILCSVHDYQTLLILVRVYLNLGTISLAYKTYPRLSIKQIQNDTLSHNIFTRISTMHPGRITKALDISAGAKAELDPVQGLQTALKIYTRSREQIPQMTKMALEHGNYHEVEGLLQLEKNVENSICKFMWRLECRRIARLLCKPALPSNLGAIELLDSLPDSLSDNRDDDVIVNCETSGGAPFERYIRVGPKPGTSWVRAFAICDRLMDMVTDSNKSDINKAEVEMLASKLRRETESEAATEEFTDTELQYLRLQMSILEVLDAFPKKPAGEKHFDALTLQKLYTWLEERAKMQDRELDTAMKVMDIQNQTPYPSWKTLHDAFSTLDALRSLVAFFNFASSRGKSSEVKAVKTALMGARELGTRISRNLRSQIAQTMNKLLENKEASSLVDLILERDAGGQGVVGALLEELIGEAWVEKFAFNIIGSWTDALEGVLNVNVKLD